MVRSWACAAAMVAVLATAASARAACTVGRIAELPVTMSGLSPLVSAKINGEDARFIADSGAFYSVISPAGAAQHHLRLSPAAIGAALEGVGGRADISLTYVKTFTLAGTAIHDVTFVVGGSQVGEDAVGVLGQNVLHIADVEYDFAGGMLRLFQPHGCDGADLAYWNGGRRASTMELNRTDPGTPFTTGVALVNGVKIRVMFDTGSQLSMMTLSAARRAGIAMDGPGVVSGGAASGVGRGTVATWIAPVATLDIGDEQVRNTRLRIADLKLTDTDMLIGGDFFLSHRVYVANGRRRLYFTYNGGPVFDLRPAGTAPGAVATARPSGAAPAAPEPTDAEGFARRGAAFAARGDYDRAVADDARAAALAPTEPRYVYQRALAQMGARRPFLAMADLDATLKLKPDDAQALTMRAALRLSGKDASGARADLDAASAAFPREADQRLRLAQLYLSAELLEPAVAQFGLWIAVHGEDSRLARALNGRCWARALLGRELDRALADCDAALRLTPRSADVLDSRGLVRLRRGEFVRAVADYDAALKLSPKTPWSLYGRGLAELKTGKKAEGEADLAAAADLDAGLRDRAAKLGIGP